MDANSLDLTITSPPYDDIRGYNGYSFDFKVVANGLYRTTKQGGIVIWVVGDATVKGSETGTSFKQALYFKEIGFNLHDTMIYYKNNPMPQTNNRYHQHFEYMFCLSKGAPNTFNPIIVPTKYKGFTNMKNRGKTGSLEYTRVKRTSNKKVGNVFFYSIGGGLSTKDKVAYGHPAIFPEQLAIDQINTWTNENDLVYDPFMGSGTVAKCCKLLKRNYIGSEISKEYCIIIKKRINQSSET